MEKLNIQKQDNHTFLAGINKFGDIRGFRRFEGKWYSAYCSKSGKNMIFEESSEFFVKECIYLFDESILTIDEKIIDAMSNFLVKSIAKHLQAKEKMENFFKQIG